MILLYEPLATTTKPGHGPDFDAFILATVSPSDSRYKEFLKLSATALYMPVYKLAELLSIGAYLRLQFPSDADVQRELQVEKILARVNDFGGILRHVIHMHPTKLVVRSFSKSELLKSGLNITTSDTPLSVSDLLLQMVPHYDLAAFDQAIASDPPKISCSAFLEQFRSFHYRLASRWVRNAFETHISDPEWHEMLQKLDNGLVAKWAYYPHIFECVVGEMLTQRKNTIPLKWALCRPQRKWQSVTFDKSSPFFLNEKVFCDGDFLHIDSMQAKKLYIPCQPQYSAVDMLFKSSDGGIYGMQVTRAASHSKDLKTYNNFFDKIGLDVDSANRFTLIVVTTPDNGETSYLKKVDWIDWVSNKIEAQKQTIDPSLPQERITKIRFGVMVPANRSFLPVIGNHAIPLIADVVDSHSSSSIIQPVPPVVETLKYQRPSLIKTLHI